MSLFIAGQAFPGASEFAAAKIAIFMASIIAGAAGRADTVAAQASCRDMMVGRMRELFPVIGVDRCGSVINVYDGFQQHEASGCFRHALA